MQHNNNITLLIDMFDFSDATSEAIDFQWVDFLVPVELLRDSIQSPWGFRSMINTFQKRIPFAQYFYDRLRGGSDVDGGIPFEIIKV